MNGKIKHILRFFRTLIFHYQIGQYRPADKDRRPEGQAHKILLSWVKAMLLTDDINFTTKWRDGLLLSALVDHCKPGLIPNHASLNPDNWLDNIQRAMDLAESELKVPKVLRPEDLAVHQPDEFSVMTYISGFCDHELASLLAWVNSKIPDRPRPVSNFTTDWKDGSVLAALIEVLTKRKFKCSQMSFDDCCQEAMGAADRLLGVSKISPSEAKNDVALKFIWSTYVTQLKNATLLVPVSVDPSKCSIINFPKGRLQTNNHYSFDVDTSEAGFGELKASAHGPTVPETCTLKDSGNGVYSIEFTPSEVGLLQVGVSFDDYAIPLSPFEFTVNDPIRVKANFPEGRLQANKSYSIDIDTSEAGFGELKASAHGPTVPEICSVKDSGNGFYRIEFTPSEVGLLKVEVSFDDYAIPLSPFEFTVNDPTKVKANFPEGRLQANKSYSINIDTSKAGFGELKASAHGPTVPETCTIKDSGTGVYSIEFTPSEVGLLKVEVSFDEYAIPQSPFEFTVNDPAKVKAKFPEGRLQANKSYSINIDTSEAGFGELKAFAHGPTVPETCSVKNSGNGVHNIELTPSEVGLLKVEVSLDDYAIPQSPFEFTVNDPAKVKANFPEGRLQANKSYSINIDTSEAGFGELKASAHGPTVQETCTIKDGGTGVYSIEFTPSEVGLLKVEVSFDDYAIPQSPLEFTVTPFTIKDKPQADKVVCTGPFYKVGSSEPVTLDVNAENAGAGKLSASCSGSKGNSPSVDITEKEPKKYVLAFTPPEDDIYILNVYWMSEKVKNSPFEINLIPPDASKCIVNGPEVPIDPTEPIILYVDASNAGNGAIAVSAVGDETGEKDVLVKETESHKYVLSFIPNISEMYTMNITWGGENVPGAPFRVSNSAMNILICEPPPTTIEAGQAIGICFDTSKGGKGTLTAICKGNSTGEILITVSVAENKHNIRFIPPKPDVFIVRVLWNGVDIKGSPFTINLTLADDRKMHEITPNMPHGPFFIEYIEAPAEEIPTHPITKPYLIQYLPDDNIEDLLSYAIHDKSGTCTTLKVREGRENKTYFILKAEKTGLHHIHIKHKDEEIHGSPFKLEIIESDSSACKIVKVPDRAYIGEEVSLKIDVTKAGSGDMHVLATVPQGGKGTGFSYAEGPLGLYTIKFTPKVAGKHEMIIKWAGVPIPGCPVTINAYDFSERVQQARDAASRVKVAHLKHQKIFTSKLLQSDGALFYIVTQQAGHGYLTVKAKGPGDARIDVYKRKNTEYKCEVYPVVSGKYDITILWNSFPIPGNPFQLDFTAEKMYIINELDLESVHFFLGQPYEFHVDCGQNEGILEVSAHPSSCAAIEVVPNEINNGAYLVEITPKVVGNHEISIKFANRHILQSPYHVQFESSDKQDQEFQENVNLQRLSGLDFPISLEDSELPEISAIPPELSNKEPGKVRASGPGLKGVVIGQEGNFIIETEDAGEGTLEVGVHSAEGTFKTNMRRHPNNDRTMLVRYDPIFIGMYTIDILWCDKHIEGSPFVVDIKPQETSKSGM